MRNCFSKRIALLFVLACIISIPYSAPVVAESVQNQSISNVIDNAIDDGSLKPGIQGVYVKSLDSGNVLYERNIDLGFLPASNFKLLATAATLDLLGPNYKMATSVYLTAKPTLDGTVNGDLVIVGHGDPVLKTEDLQELVGKLKAYGVKSINGNIIGDDSWFNNIKLGTGWEWDDEQYYYSAQISGLNLNENVIDVTIKPGQKVGDSASIVLSPATDYLSINNYCKTSIAKSEKTTLIERLYGKNAIDVTGNIPIDCPANVPDRSVTVEEPTLYACSVLKDILKSNGIEVCGKTEIGRKPDSAELVATHYSPPISEMLKLVNKPSDNLIAECLFKNLGREIGGQGSSDASAKVETDFLKKIGGDIGEINIADGSGLSREDLISPKNIVAILSYMFYQKNGEYYINSLPVAGVDGTLRNRLKGTFAANNLKAKTGSINHVSSLSGIVKTKAGENIVFSIIMNNQLTSLRTCRHIQDKIVLTLANITTKIEPEARNTAAAGN